jgi:molybdopterin-biosynthesis enzyme MoeA-like protein
MAKIPKISKPLLNPVGTAPGVLIKYKGITLIVLPGVPEEMIAIFNDSVETLLHDVLGDMFFFEVSLDVKKISESELAPVIYKVMLENPYVYIKSHPKIAEKFLHLELHVSTTSKESKIAHQRIGKVITQISEWIKKKGGTIRPIKPK